MSDRKLLTVIEWLVQCENTVCGNETCQICRQYFCCLGCRININFWFSLMMQNLLSKWLVVRRTETDWVQSSGLTGMRHSELTADRGDGSPAGHGVTGCCFCHCSSLISPPARSKMYRLLLLSLETDKLLPCCQWGKILIKLIIR